MSKKDSWCNKLYYNGKQISGGAARQVRVAQVGGVEAIIERVSKQVYDEATLAANTANAGRIIQMPIAK